MGFHLALLSSLGSNLGVYPYRWSGDEACAITNEGGAVLAEGEKQVANGAKLFIRKKLLSFEQAQGLSCMTQSVCVK